MSSVVLSGFGLWLLRRGLRVSQLVIFQLGAIIVGCRFFGDWNMRLMTSWFEPDRVESVFHFLKRGMA